MNIDELSTAKLSGALSLKEGCAALINDLAAEGEISHTDARQIIKRIEKEFESLRDKWLGSEGCGQGIPEVSYNKCSRDSVRGNGPGETC